MNDNHDLDAYIERIKAIKWFQPSEKIDKTSIEKQTSVILKAFGIEATLEFKTLKTPNDYDAARDAARDAAWYAARDAAWYAARGAARGAASGAALDAASGAAWDAAWYAALDAARGAAKGAASGAAWDAARGAEDFLAQSAPGYKNPNGTFVHLIPIYEAGLWPLGVIDGKFVIAVPATSVNFPEIS